jgi:hypothetical protein
MPALILPFFKALSLAFVHFGYAKAPLLVCAAQHYLSVATRTSALRKNKE